MSLFSRFRIPRYFRRLVWLVLGILCAVVGILGIILPIIPGTLFLLIAVVIFVNKQDLALQWLQQNETTGPVLRHYQRKMVLHHVLKKIF